MRAALDARSVAIRYARGFVLAARAAFIALVSRGGIARRVGIARGRPRKFRWHRRDSKYSD